MVLNLCSLVTALSAPHPRWQGIFLSGCCHVKKKVFTHICSASC